MLVMVIERFKNRDADAIWKRYLERGRMLPDGVSYVDSWVEPNYDRCFQLMECADLELLKQWSAQWEDLVDFEFFPVLTSDAAWEKFTVDMPV
ncbi:MAG: DUF3303 domain-containing protein [Candidatus Obscuribacterales bacterium]|nr:DUF3303 domain-containing protein [Candidatus Obscuribacterales bacterium]